MLVKILISEKRKITKDKTNIQLSKYQSFENKRLVKDKKTIDQNIDKQNFKLIDARSKDRFDGKVSEPREGLRSGNIKDSFCIPFNQCLNENDAINLYFNIDEQQKGNLKCIN